MTAKFPALPRNQRVVLEHISGPHVGLFQIIGHTGELNGDPPSLAEDIVIEPGKRTASASLVRSKPRYVLYREIAPSQLGTFDKAQR